MSATRPSEELRPVSIQRGFISHAEGSVLIAMGRTRVICTASVEKGTAPFLRDRVPPQGWVTAEYGMLPRSTTTRNSREAAKGKQGGRTVEISRLIGRSLRAAVDLGKLGDFSILIDCDVIEADGGTRCASITGAMVALHDAVDGMLRKGLLAENPIRHMVAAVSVGIVEGVPTLDLCYVQDSKADTDMNVVMTDDGRYVELQGTAEHEPFSEDDLTALRVLARRGCERLFEIQRATLAQAFPA